MRYAIGIDLGGTSIKYALVNEQGEYLTDGKLPTHAQEGAEKIISQLLVAISEVKKHAADQQLPISGIGIGTPGIVDEKTGTVLGGAENLSGWENIPLSDIIRTNTLFPTFVDNDANVMGWAESVFGKAKGCSDVVFLTIGTGIGGALVIDGKLYGGYKNRGTELGHIPLIADGEICACGSTGCLEHYASAAAMVRRFKEKANVSSVPFDKSIDGEHIIRLYQEGNPLAIEILNEHCRFLGHAIGGFINIFSPQKIVIGGGLADAGEFYIEKIRQEATRYSLTESAVNTSIEAASLGNKAGCLGAAGLVFAGIGR